MATMKIKSIHISQFKGVLDVTYNFDCEDAKVLAENGTGKSTIADAFYWLFADKDSSLTSNPPIRPNNMEEALPRVEVVIDLGGVEITACKSQKRTVGKADENGISRISLSNAYEINSVPKSEKDFKAYFLERVVDLSLFMELSHPDVFTSGLTDKKQREHMRSVLFGMCNEYTDYDIAIRTKGLEKLAELLTSYKLEEIEAMNASTMKKANEQMEQIPFRIVGMEESKVAENRAELEAQKEKLEQEIAKIHTKSDVSNSNEEYLKGISNQLAQLRAKAISYKNDKQAETESQKLEINKEISDKRSKIAILRSEMEANNRYIYSERNTIAREKNVVSVARAEYLKEKDAQFDEHSLVCPTCGREYEPGKVEQIKADFEKNKTITLNRIVEKGNTAKSVIETSNTNIDNYTKRNEQIEADISVIKRDIDVLEDKLSAVPEIDFSKDTELAAINSQIEELSSKLTSISGGDDANVLAETKLKELQNELYKVKDKLSLVRHNAEIDKQIALLKEQLVEYENAKAKCEMFLKDLIPTLKKKKNDILSEEINNHFGLVKFKLFDFQKNGNYIEVCEPMIDGKSFSSESNGALKILAKLDIISGLQNYYGLNVPVIVDGFESVTSNTESRIEHDYQLIKLVADDRYKEITITKGDN